MGSREEREEAMRKRRDARYCDQGCGYKLPEEYSDDETTCGACLDETEEREPWP